MRSLVWPTISLCALALAGCDAAAPETPRVDPVPVLPGVEPAPDDAVEPVEIEIDLDAALELVLPEIEKDLTPVAFETSDGKDGWVVRIPGNLPIATPADDWYMWGGNAQHNKTK